MNNTITQMSDDRRTHPVRQAGEYPPCSPRPSLSDELIPLIAFLGVAVVAAHALASFGGLIQ